MFTKISLIILDYKKSWRVVENVKLLLEQKSSVELEIIIVDNSCSEANKNKLLEISSPKVKMFFNEKNNGYIGGINQGMKESSGDLLFIVSPDILIKDKDLLEKMNQYLSQNPKIGILGTKQINDDGSKVLNVRAFPRFYVQVARRTWLKNLPILKEIVAYDEMRHLDLDKVQRVDWLQSSFVAMPRKVWEQVGELDRRFFIFMADPDLCRRVWLAGFEVVYNPDFIVYADGKRASAGGIKTFFKSWILRQHVIDSTKYRFKYLFSPKISR